MTPAVSVVSRNGPMPWSVLRSRDDFGTEVYDLLLPPDRFWADQTSIPASVVQDIDANRTNLFPTPCELLNQADADQPWLALGRRSLARLLAYFLICEDPQRRLVTREVNTLAHQVSLVRHILDSPHLRRVLIADEVGLGKTIEAALLLQELLRQQPGLRVLYLAPARLVSNVRMEFDRLHLGFRQWSSEDADARLSDPRIIASIHRAVHGRHFDSIVHSTPWDVLIVDECHHLSDWSPGGGDPTQKFRLVRDLIERQPSGGRVIFLSGTPHQGHPDRFQNLLGLLRDRDEPEEAIRGRVIYRTKEDVTDWNGQPLFPRRHVHEPIVIDLGARYRTWLAHIHDYFRPRLGQLSEPRLRAAGWRVAQAMQWATSSPQAGLGYLVRQAIRTGWTLQREGFSEAVAELRPYRFGPADEPIERLYHRIAGEVARQNSNQDLEDIEESTESDPLPHEPMQTLLQEGINLIRIGGDEKWEQVYQRILLPAGSEKVVLFAQPIETVSAVAAYLRRRTGEEPAVIVGGQTDSERREVVDQFRRLNGPRYLISSRAGGEGINLQVSRRLVHLDVPWNPMDMEQRVGRVHRFGSRQTILVDTVVVSDSREANAYQVARQRLRLIAGTLVEPERFEAIFSRVMNLVSPQELSDVIVRDLRVPLDSREQEVIANLVREGYRTWNDFNQRYGEQQRQIRQQNPGLADWNWVEHFLVNMMRATPRDGFTSQRLVWRDDQIEATPEPARVVALGDGNCFACGDYAGTPIYAESGQSIPSVGLNLSHVTEGLRRCGFPDEPVGPAHLRWPAELPLFRDDLAYPFGILVLVRQSVRPDVAHGGYQQAGATMLFYLVDAQSRRDLLSGDETRRLMPGLFAERLRARAETAQALIQSMHGHERRLIQELRRPSDEERALQIRHAIMPLFAAVVWQE